jgi:hypothetical protein
MPDQAIRCVIQTAAANSWPAAVAPRSAQDQPRDTSSNATHEMAPMVDHMAVVKNQAIGGGNEPNARPGRCITRRTACAAADWPELALRARRAARLMARGGLAGRASSGWRARRTAAPIPAAMSATASTNPDASTVTAGRIGCTVAAAAASTTAPPTQPIVVTAATTASRGDAAGLASQADTCPGRPGCAGPGAGQDATPVQAVPFHQRIPQPAGSRYQPAAGGTQPADSSPGAAQLPLMSHHANARIVRSGQN